MRLLNEEHKLSLTGPYISLASVHPVASCVTHQCHYPHAVEVLSSAARGELWGRAPTDRWGGAGQGQSSQRGGDRGPFTQLCQIQAFHAATGNAGLQLLGTQLRRFLLLLNHPEQSQMETQARFQSCFPTDSVDTTSGHSPTPPHVSTVSRLDSRSHGSLGLMSWDLGAPTPSEDICSGMGAPSFILEQQGHRSNREGRKGPSQYRAEFRLFESVSCVFLYLSTAGFLLP